MGRQNYVILFLICLFLHIKHIHSTQNKFTHSQSTHFDVPTSLC
jgi:hypothetical protein